MNFQKVVLACLILICVFAVSCQKLDQAPPTTAPFKFEKMKYPDAIPAEYGNLVGVTVSPAYPTWAQLWFQKPDKTIVIVKVQWKTGETDNNVLIIPRR